jgi:hypothetical protein
VILNHEMMKEEKSRSISVPGITTTNSDIENVENDFVDIQQRPGSLFEVFMALKERDR